jgi:cell cycle checkpoint control protein RAD9A
VDKTVDRCELSIVEGASPSDDEREEDSEERDSLESRLIVRLHCKHGTVPFRRSVTRYITGDLLQALSKRIGYSY